MVRVLEWRGVFVATVVVAEVEVRRKAGSVSSERRRPAWRGVWVL